MLLINVTPINSIKKRNIFANTVYAIINAPYFSCFDGSHVKRN